MAKKDWYQFRAKAIGQAELLLYDEIGEDPYGEGIGARQLVEDLRKFGNVKDLIIRVNSPGGSVFAGLAIYNALRAHPAKKTVYIDGLAASVAGVICMSGDAVLIAENGFLMLHNPSGMVVGTSSDLRSLADTLDKIKQGLIAAYRDKSGLPDEQLADMMDQETWLDATEATALHLADRIVEPVRFAAHFDLRRFAHPPEQLLPQGDNPMSQKNQTLRNQQQTPEPVPADPNPETPPTEEPAEQPTPPPAEEPQEDPAAVRARAAEIVRLCADAGAPKFAIQAIAQNLSVPTVIARLASAAEIRNLCATAGLTDLAAGFIESGLSTEQVRARLFDQLVARDHATITSHILPAASQVKPIDSAKIYADRRAAIAKGA